jgi:uncharacterized repeat protein (TIGR01451 family)
MVARVFLLLASICGAAVWVAALQAAPGLIRRETQAATVIISEVAWSGTKASSADEWIELHNPSESAVDLAGWQVTTGGGNVITLNGVISAHGFFLLERTADDTISDVPADQIYTGSLNNAGDTLSLHDSGSALIDTVNSDGGPWPAGIASPDYVSMERSAPLVPDADENWLSNDTVTRNGLDTDGMPVNGTPRQPNSTWQPAGGEPDLEVHKTGPPLAGQGSHFQYTIMLSNAGPITASGVILTDSLPYGLEFVDEDSGYPFSRPLTGTLRWQIALLAPEELIDFRLTVAAVAGIVGPITNTVTATTILSETNIANNSAKVQTVITTGDAPAVLIEAIYYDGLETNEPDEALRLINTGTTAVDLAGWQLSDGTSTAVFPSSALIAADAGLWVARQATAFSRQFGFKPDFEADSSDLDVPDIDGAWPGFSNSGDEVILRNGDDDLLDVVVYEDGDTGRDGWQGPAVEPFIVPGVFGGEGQILYRMRDQTTGRPLPDSNTSADWAQSTVDEINGRKVRYPGWDLDAFFFTRAVTEPAELIVAIAPDNGHDFLVGEIGAAQSSLSIETHTFRSQSIADALIAALGRGVTVTVLLEGAPVSGIDDQERLACKRLENAGGQCWFMVSDDAQDIFDRYRFLHAKFVLIDNQRVIIGSENLSPDSLPDDDKRDGTSGRRGVLLATDASGVVERVQAIWQADFEPDAHHDIFRWSAGHPKYGDPSPGTEPITVTGGISYTVRYTMPALFSDATTFEVIQSPENSLRDHDSILGLLKSTGFGDTILVQQLSERPYWGASASNSAADPNPRLEGYIEAARRGAVVRLLLDDYFDDISNDTSNRATCNAVNSIAGSENLDLECALANPTGSGLHNKMILFQIGGAGFVNVGSINGTELSNKGNREVALQVQSDGAFALLAGMFHRDWPQHSYLPIISRNFAGPAKHALISEVLYDPTGPDDAEFIEIVNPTGQQVDLSHFALGDAVSKSDFEDVRRFPAGTLLPPGRVIVVAATATGFNSRFGFNPDFEIFRSDDSVPELIDDESWGDPAAKLRLANMGDEVILRDPADQIVDAVTYGSGALPGIVPCSLLESSDFSLERYPYWGDSNDCPFDFRAWPFPGPGSLP